MRINTFFYSIRQGLKNIFRNKMFSLASMATMAACIFMFGLFYIIVTNFSATVHLLKKVCQLPYSLKMMRQMHRSVASGKRLTSVPRLSKNEYVSADEHGKEYKKVYFQGKEELADGFTDNPLANSAHYQVYLNDVSMQDSLVTYIKGLTGVREVKESAQVANTLTDFNKLLGYVSGGIYPDSVVRGCLFDQQYRNGRYFGPKGRNCHYETDRGNGFPCACTVYCGRNCDRTDRSCDSAWCAVFYVSEDYCLYCSKIQFYRFDDRV